MEHFHRVAGRLRQGVRTTSRLRDWQGGDCRAAGVHHPGVFKVRLPGEEDFIHSHTPMPALRSGAVSRPQRRSQHLAPRSRTLGHGVERYEPPLLRNASRTREGTLGESGTAAMKGQPDMVSALVEPRTRIPGLRPAVANALQGGEYVNKLRRRQGYD